MEHRVSPYAQDVFGITGQQLADCKVDLCPSAYRM